MMYVTEVDILVLEVYWHSVTELNVQQWTDLRGRHCSCVRLFCIQCSVVPTSGEKLKMVSVQDVIGLQ